MAWARVAMTHAQSDAGFRRGEQTRHEQRDGGQPWAWAWPCPGESCGTRGSGHSASLRSPAPPGRAPTDSQSPCLSARKPSSASHRLLPAWTHAASFWIVPPVSSPLLPDVRGAMKNGPVKPDGLILRLKSIVSVAVRTKLFPLGSQGPRSSF